MEDEVELVATLGEALSDSPAQLDVAGRPLSWLECRSDLTSGKSVDWLRGHFGGRLLYSRPARPTGDTACRDSSSEANHDRHRHLIAAAGAYDLIELDAERDLEPRVLDAVPAEKRLISWSGEASEVAVLRTRFARIAAVKARFYKLETQPRRFGDEVIPLKFLGAVGRRDVSAYATGELGFWSRIVSTQLGSPLIFGRLSGQPRGQGEPTVDQLINDYGFPAVRRTKSLFGILGNPVLSSLSPRLHNAANRALDLAALFVPFHADSFADFRQALLDRGSPWSGGPVLQGLVVISPFKEAVLDLAKTCRGLTRAARSGNVLIGRRGGWDADTTDSWGVLQALREHRVKVRGKPVAVVGCGGSGRAIAAALKGVGAQVTLVNRSPRRGLWAAQLLQLPCKPFVGFSVEGFAVIVNATPVGYRDELPFQLTGLRDDAMVIDLPYRDRPTPLVSQVRRMGGLAVDGRTVLRIQAMRQFQMLTGREMPRQVVSNCLGEY